MEKLCSKLSRYCHITCTIKDHLTVEASRDIYYALIHSIVSYGLLVLDGRLINWPVAETLHKLQNKIILNLFGSTTGTINFVGSIFKRLCILQFRDLYKMKICVTMYKILNEGYALFLYDTVNVYVREHDHNTRNHNQFLLPYPGICNVNFLYLAIGYWNNLENVFKEAGSSNVLKTVIK